MKEEGTQTILSGGKKRDLINFLAVFLEALRCRDIVTSLNTVVATSQAQNPENVNALTPKNEKCNCLISILFSCFVSQFFGWLKKYI